MKHLNSHNRILLLGILIGLLVSCDQKTVVHSYQHTDEQGWWQSDTLSFDIPALTASGLYSLSVGARIRPSYRYRNLKLVVDIQLQDSTLQQCDTICIQTTDSLGNTLGSGISLLQHEPTVLSLPLNKGQHGTIRIHHIMPHEVISGIHDIGIKLER